MMRSVLIWADVGIWWVTRVLASYLIFKGPSLHGSTDANLHPIEHLFKDEIRPKAFQEREGQLNQKLHDWWE